MNYSEEPNALSYCKYFDSKVKLEDIKVKKFSSGRHSNTYTCAADNSETILFLKKANNKLEQLQKLYNSPKVFEKNIHKYTIENEYKTLKRLNNLLGPSVPKVFDYISKEETLVMEYIESKPFSKIINNSLRNPFNRFNKVKKILEEIINVLTIYESKIFEDDFLEIDFFLPIIIEKVSKISFIDAEEKNRLVEYLKKESVLHSSIPVHFVHKDFKPHNILISNERLVIIDWEMADKNLFAFWMPSIFIRTMSYYFSRSLFHRGSFSNLESFFIETYFKKTAFKDYKPFFKLATIFDLIIALSESPESQNRIKPGIGIKTSLYKLRKLINE